MPAKWVTPRGGSMTCMASCLLVTSLLCLFFRSKLATSSHSLPLPPTRVEVHTYLYTSQDFYFDITNGGDGSRWKSPPKLTMNTPRLRPQSFPLGDHKTRKNLPFEQEYCTATSFLQPGICPTFYTRASLLLLLCELLQRTTVPLGCSENHRSFFPLERGK